MVGDVTVNSAFGLFLEFNLVCLVFGLDKLVVSDNEFLLLDDEFLFLDDELVGCALFVHLLISFLNKRNQNNFLILLFYIH